MAWYAYCLTEQQNLNNGVRTRRPFLLEGIQGVNGAPVLSYPSGEFAVVVSEYDRTAEGGDKPDIDDVKAKFREALDRKRQVHAEGQGKGSHEAGKVSGAHGPAASRRNFRRKSG